MKIRNGFVSNSSSSSFVVVLPKNFNTEKFVNEKLKFNSYVAGDILEGYEYEGDDEDAFVKEKAIQVINKFIKNKSVDEDDYPEMSIIEGALSDYIISTFDVSSDAGCGVLVSADKIEKILNS